MRPPFAQLLFILCFPFAISTANAETPASRCAIEIEHGDLLQQLSDLKARAEETGSRLLYRQLQTKALEARNFGIDLDHLRSPSRPKVDPTQEAERAQEAREAINTWHSSQWTAPAGTEGGWFHSADGLYSAHIDRGFQNTGLLEVRNSRSGDILSSIELSDLAIEKIYRGAFYGFTEDGREIFFSSGAQAPMAEVFLIDWNAKSVTRKFSTRLYPAQRQIRFSGNGQRFLTRRNQTELVIDFQTGDILTEFASPDYRLISGLSYDGTVAITFDKNLVTVRNVSSSTRTVLIPSFQDLMGGSLNAAGTKALVYGSSSMELWDTSVRQKLKSYDFDGKLLLADLVNADRMIVAITQSEGFYHPITTIRIFETETGNQIESYEIEGEASEFHIAKDGDRVLYTDAHRAQSILIYGTLDQRGSP